MIVINIQIIWPDGGIYPSYNEVLDKNFPQKIRAWTYHNWEEWIIDKWETRYLMRVKPIDGEYLKREWFEIIKQFSLKIVYKDIFGDEHTIYKSTDILFDWATYYWL